MNSEQLAMLLKDSSKAPSVTARQLEALQKKVDDRLRPNLISAYEEAAAAPEGDTERPSQLMRDLREWRERLAVFDTLMSSFRATVEEPLGDAASLEKAIAECKEQGLLRPADIFVETLIIRHMMEHLEKGDDDDWIVDHLSLEYLAEATQRFDAHRVQESVISQVVARVCRAAGNDSVLDAAVAKLKAFVTKTHESKVVKQGELSRQVDDLHFVLTFTSRPDTPDEAFTRLEKARNSLMMEKGCCFNRALTIFDAGRETQTIAISD